MSKKDANSEPNGENINSLRLSKTFSKTPDLLLTNSKNNQRSQNSKKNNYAPNLNVVRNRNLEIKSNDKDPRKESNNRKNQRGKDRANNSKRVNPNLVQTMGFLSEGIGDMSVQNRKVSDYSGAYSKDSCVEAIKKPILSSSKHDAKYNKEIMEKEQTTLSSLLEDDIEEDDDSKNSADDIRPVKIDSVIKNDVKNEKLEVKIKVEPVEYDVKNECTDSSQMEFNGTIKTEPGTEIKSEYYHRMDRLFRPDPNEVILFQLPDTLPQKLPDEVEESTSEGAANPKPQKLSSLEHFSEGIIGKLIRYRSGRTKLMIGEYLYDVETAITSNFQQSAVSISSNAQERSANMYSLGEVKAKYNIIPDWEWLLDKAVKE